MQWDEQSWRGFKLTSFPLTSNFHLVLFLFFFGVCSVTTSMPFLPHLLISPCFSFPSIRLGIWCERGVGVEKHIHLFFSFSVLLRKLRDCWKRTGKKEGFRRFCRRGDGILGCGITVGCPLGFLSSLRRPLNQPTPGLPPTERRFFH